ncbi:hypothetical protein SAMN05444008_12038 [Cnuella takakiae]|uniref:Uncharacterized protein n=1 Tax=Cnuella takakiae TaxID=1302690 RepID=A0A1M5HSE2_9BACT|nr:hypothetical protein [Cnuella takakiae]OLY95657.1 hypothetical protein BUE76_00090 [Cnuella takakiae]SHG18857.1 hypothetical protein SAMN05444008_12038 [Cnuella takakiae]
MSHWLFVNPGSEESRHSRFSLFREKQASLENLEVIIWKYEVLADDYNGLGKDKNFVNAGHHEKDPFVLFSMPDL